MSLAVGGQAAAQAVHQHGVSQLDVAMQGDALLLSLHGPAHNFVGFEHAPHTDEERSRHAQALERLRAADALFGLPAAAGCRLEDASVEAGTNEQHGDHDHANHGHDHGTATDHPDHEHKHDQGRQAGDADHHAHGESTDDHGHEHADWRADYTYRCSTPQALTAITVELFEHYPGTAEIRYQLAGDGMQGGGTLRAGSNRIGMH